MKRRGFTLVELLVVIVVIGIMASLLMPAIFGAQRRARVAGVQTEISGLQQALAAFKISYGIEPPSSFVLCESGSDWNQYPQHKSIVRRCWPQFDFSFNYDHNGDGDMTDVLALDGAECLVFFLSGFNRNPGTPFATGGSRSAALIEFDVGRLIDNDGDTIREYRDPLRAGSVPYVYYSAYEGRGYVLAELCYGMTDFYRLSAGGPPHRAQSYQIISPGVDGILGTGGPWSKEDTSLITARPTEIDNVTNFGAGELGR